MVRRKLRNCLILFPYKLQILQAYNEGHKQKQLQFVEHCFTKPKIY